MRTIDKLLPYSLSEEQKSLLTQANIINWVWGAWECLEDIMDDILLLIQKHAKKKIDVNKLQSLWNDIQRLSIPHDIEFYFKLWFYRSNFRFAKNLFHLLHWAWYKGLIIAILTFGALNKRWKKFYFNKK